MTSRPDLITTEEAARLLGYSPGHVRRLCKRGVIPAFQFPGCAKWFIKADELARIMEGANDGKA